MNLYFYSVEYWDELIIFLSIFHAKAVVSAQLSITCFSINHKGGWYWTTTTLYPFSGHNYQSTASQLDPPNPHHSTEAVRGRSNKSDDET